MALTKAPLFSLDASGALADSIVFSKWKGRTYVRRHSIPSNPRSGLQIGMRSVFTFMTQYFKSLLPAELLIWHNLAANDNITSLNSLIRDAQFRARIGQGWRVDTGTIETTIDPPTGVTALAIPKGVRLSWTRPAANQGTLSTAIYMNLTGAFTRDISKLHHVVPVATVTVDIVGLTTGVPYYFETAETGKKGLIGTASAEANATPT